MTSLTVRITPGSGPVLGRASWPRNLAIGLIRQAGHTKIAATIRKIRPCSWPSAACKTHHDQHKRLCRSPCSLPGLAPAVLRLLYLGLTNASAFNPADTMSMVPCAKTAMGVPPLNSIALIGLVITQAVNVFA